MSSAPVQVRPLSEVRDEIIETLRRELVRDKVRSFIQKLRDGAAIDVHPDYRQYYQPAPGAGIVMHAQIGQGAISREFIPKAVSQNFAWVHSAVGRQVDQQSLGFARHAAVYSLAVVADRKTA